MKLIVLFLFLILFFSTAYAQTYSVALDPTKMSIFLDNRMNKVETYLRVWNPSQTDNNYTIEIPEELKNYMRWDCNDEWRDTEYWCKDKGYFVPKGTEKFVNDTIIKLLFLKRTDENVDKVFYFYLYPNPQFTSNSENLRLVPRAEIKLHLIQSFAITTTTHQTYSSGGNQIISKIISTTTTTTPKKVIETVYKDNQEITREINETTIQKEEKKSGFPTLNIILIIVMIVVIGFVGYYIFVNYI